MRIGLEAGAVLAQSSVVSAIKRHFYRNIAACVVEETADFPYHLGAGSRVLRHHELGDVDNVLRFSTMASCGLIVIPNWFSRNVTTLSTAIELRIPVVISGVMSVNA